MPMLPWYLRARLKTRQLLLLIAIDEEGNLHRAAEVLHMSQPAASKLLKDLEELMGVALFERLPRGMRPTWYGESMIRHARIALSSLGEAGAEIEALKAGHAGTVAIGTIAGPAMSLLPEVVARITREHPGLRLSLTVESSDVLLEALAQNRLDLMIGRLFERHDKRHLNYQPLVEEQVCAIARPDHPILTLPAPTLADLAGEAWIVPPEGSVLRHRFELMFHNAGLEVPRQLIGTAALVLIPKLLQQSGYLAVVPVDVARHYAEHDMARVVPTQLSCHMDAFGLITRTDWLLSPGAQLVLELLKTVAGEVYGVEASLGSASVSSSMAK